MSESTRVFRPAESEQAAPSDGIAPTYVYGIVPADVEVTADARGLGEPAGRIELVSHGDIAALISEVDVDRPLGRPDDLMAHERLLDDVAEVVPVLPLRFGAVLANRQAVVDELLEPYQEEFLAALNELEGRAEYVVKGRYIERAVLTEVLAENAEAAGLRDEVRSRPEEATRNARMRLGEIIAGAVEAKRETDTQVAVQELRPLYSMAVIREPSHEQDAVHLAVLAETARQRELEQAVDELARRWEGRVELRLLGPLAPYDFVTTAQEE
jgi:hypothetical protein